MSDTHYWMFNAPPSSKRAHRLRKHEQEMEKMKDQHPAKVDTNSVRLFRSCSSYNGVKSPSYKQQYVNMPANSEWSSPVDNHEKLTRRSVALTRGRSELGQDHLHTFQHQLVTNLRFLVPLATIIECEAVLIGSGWSFDDALKRLKLELVCRTEYASKQCCQRLLEKYNWSLEDAMEHIKAGRPVPDRRPHSRRPYTLDGNMPSMATNPPIIPSILVSSNQADMSPTSSTGDGRFTPEVSPSATASYMSPFM